MKIQLLSRTLLAAAILAGSTTLLIGCAAGDENPITPDKMEEIRKQEANQRGNFQPKGGPPPTGQ
jgi:hypothetical protein